MSRWQGFDSNSVEMSKPLNRDTIASWASVMRQCGEDATATDTEVVVFHNGVWIGFPDERHFVMWIRHGMEWFETKRWDFDRKKWVGIDRQRKAS